MFKILTLKLKKNKKISVVFDKRLQGICFNDLQDLVKIGKIFICFFLQKPNLLRTRTANAETAQQQ